MGMQRNELIERLTGLLAEAVAEESSHDARPASPDSPLLGSNAVLTSLRLVTFITDCESILEEEYEIHVTLVSEDAFSRRKSPFRTIEALADYIVELSAPPGDGAAHSAVSE